MKKIIKFFNNKRIFILFVIIHIQFSWINSYSQSSIDSLIEKFLVTEHTIDPQLKRLNDKDNNYLLNNIMNHGYSAIPILIEFIDTKSEYIVDHGILSSTIESEYVGIVFIKIIEKIVNTDFKCYSLSVKNDSRKLTYEDIIILKQLYTIWWQNNKEKLNENNNSYIQNAIVNSNYQWEFCDLNYDLENGFY
ncbi:MAG: hypothetical protein H6Q25_1210 [Bacteroidetes bacterium]|nr:hypothetical protein [Bacteroidota bacterium]